MLSIFDDLFFQIQAVCATPLYESDSKALNKPEVQEGLKLWHAFKKFAELEENKRWDKHEVIMSKFAPLARLGKQIPKELLDEINSRVVLSNKEASLRADPEALWICYSNAEVDEINKEQTIMLEKKGKQKYTIWAKYVVSLLSFNLFVFFSLLRSTFFFPSGTRQSLLQAQV